MTTYMTEQGDTWDYIAYKTMGNADYMNFVIAANPKLVRAAVFSAGTEIVIPDVPEDDEDNDELLPEWRTSDLPDESDDDDDWMDDDYDDSDAVDPDELPEDTTPDYHSGV